MKIRFKYKTFERARHGKNDLLNYLKLKLRESVEGKSTYIKRKWFLNICP